MGRDSWLNPAQDHCFHKYMNQNFYKTKWKPIRILEKDEEMTYFNNPRKIEHKNQYDLYFQFTKPYPLFDGRKLKENRHFLPDIWENIYRQEEKKAVPAVTSLNYGKRPLYDPPEFKFNRVGQIESFYRRNYPMPVIEKPVSSYIHTAAQL